jgi:hypothetical protein
MMAGLVDPLEVHVLEPCLRVGHSRTIEAVKFCLALRHLDADSGQVGELLLDALAPLLPLRLERRRNALEPVAQIAAVTVRIDDVVAESSHFSPPFVSSCKLQAASRKWRQESVPMRLLHAF